MQTIKANSGRKYHSYALTGELPRLDDGVLVSRLKGKSLQSNSKLLKMVQHMSTKKEYLYLDLLEEGQIVKMLERQSTISSADDDEQTEKYGNKCVHELYNLSPENKSTLKYLDASMKENTRKETLRSVVKKRLNELMDPEWEETARLLCKSTRQQHRFLLLPTKKNSKLDAALKPKQLQLMRKFGIVSDYCFTEKPAETEPIKRPPRQRKHLTTLSTRRMTDDMSTLSPRASVRLPLVVPGNTLEPLRKNLQSSLT